MTGGAGLEDDLCGFRVDIDVEFGRRSDVADLEIGPTHHDDLLDARADFGRPGECQCDICQWAERNDGDRFLRLFQQGVDDEVDAMAWIDLFFAGAGRSGPSSPV